MEKEIGIYIHIPFCKSKCFYCNFASYCNMDKYIEEYINAVCNEIIKNAEILSEYKIKTVYFGGGTPSYIDSKYIVQIMNTLKLFNKSNDEFSEVTIEVNPNSVTFEKLKDYKECGINRLSVGLQSKNNEVLKSIGRTHTYSDFVTTLQNAKKALFTNISIDLIYPLPNMDINILEDTLNIIDDLKEEYNIKHISIYNLEVHENTKLDFLLKNDFLSLVDEDEEYKMREIIHSKLQNMGYSKYEISNFAIKGYESKHNINYWNQGSYLGFGVDASSFMLGSRYKNNDDIKKYINAINKNLNCIDEKDDLDKLDLMKEYVILRLRLCDGININRFNKKFSTDIFSIFGTEINDLVNKGLLLKNENTITLSKRGEEVANIVWENFV